MDIIISKMGSVYETITTEYMVLGKFNAAYVDDLIDQASKIVNFESVDVGYSSNKSASGNRTALISAELRCVEERDKLDDFFVHSCDRDRLMLIRGL